jgi:DNA-binding GntR family transcriptional regulator
MRKKNLKEQVFDELKNRILYAKLSPGVKISDNEVAREMGISRTPVREALVRLAGHGLVEELPNRGFRVRVLTLREIEDLYIMREALEVLAVRLAIQNMDSEKTRILGQLLKNYVPIINAQDFAKHIQLDHRFHFQIVSYSNNAFLTQTFRSLQDQIRIVRHYEHLRSDSYQKIYNEHQQIFNFMVKGETAKAKSAMSRHILQAMKNILTYLKDIGY